TKASTCDSKVLFASDHWDVKTLNRDKDILTVEVGQLQTDKSEEAISLKLELDLPGSYQTKNLKGVLAAICELREQGFALSQQPVAYGLRHVKELTGLSARWQTLSTTPLIICETGHTEDGWKEVLSNTNATAF